MTWPAGCRRLHRRYEHQAEQFLAFAGIAAASICFRRLNQVTGSHGPGPAPLRAQTPPSTSCARLGTAPPNGLPKTLTHPWSTSRAPRCSITAPRYDVAVTCAGLSMDHPSYRDDL
ncbi:hypothetical protein GCM10018980_16230 [Streptomyces capoamus]|uniref:Transposase n=1 Tax=Streptomyces capoamus TaxID=68183 RepID=A0A919EVT6_9ACTN|nr:hypothetical protein GCM10010501_18310 [Streptomyces libani subsp. rufus]GHG41252.1 hypothetical protein GCM10018980_16230 [Streptomyces capoamus]